MTTYAGIDLHSNNIFLGIIDSNNRRVFSTCSRGWKAQRVQNPHTVSVYRVPQMQGAGHADVLCRTSNARERSHASARCPVNASDFQETAGEQIEPYQEGITAFQESACRHRRRINLQMVLVGRRASVMRHTC